MLALEDQAASLQAENYPLSLFVAPFLPSPPGRLLVRLTESGCGLLGTRLSARAWRYPGQARSTRHTQRARGAPSMCETGVRPSAVPGGDTAKRGSGDCRLPPRPPEGEDSAGRPVDRGGRGRLWGGALRVLELRGPGASRRQVRLYFPHFARRESWLRRTP